MLTRFLAVKPQPKKAFLSPGACFSALKIPFLSVLMVSACTNEDPAKVASPLSEPIVQQVEVGVETLASTTWRGSIKTFGVIEALEEVEVAAELSGTVKTVHVQEGDRVEMGQLLLELDSQKQQLAEREAKEQVQKAQAAQKEARLKLQRRQNLAHRETISKESLDNAQLSVDSATANYRQALATMQLASRKLADTQIYSPTAGLVDVKAIEAGEPVSMGATLIKLQAVQSLRMHTWVSESDIGNVRAGESAQVVATGSPNQSYQAKIAWVGVNADASTGNFPVKLILTDETEALRPGMTASAVLQGVAVENVLLLPEAALVDRDRRRVVFVVEDGVAVKREPLLAAGFSNRLQVLGGVTSGEQVVTSGHKLLRDGTPVSTRSSN